jgi:hypothetical protein
MSWITLTEDHVKARLSGVELAAWRKAALAPGQADPVQEVLAGVTSEVRGYVGGNRNNVLDVGSTIPSELLDASMALVIARLSTRLPISMTAERKDSKDSAIALLRDVAAGRFFIGSASSPAADQPGGVELASGDGARPTSASLNGLI